MSMMALTVKPGINSQETPALNEGGWSASQLIRFKDGLIQKLGGWMRFNGNPVVGTCRGLLPWQDLVGNKYVALGTEQRLQLLFSGSLYDITPILSLSSLIDKFSTVAGSNVVTIADPANMAVAGSWVNIPTYVSVGGVVLQGFYKVTTVALGNFTVTAAKAATSTVTNGGNTAAYTTTLNASNVSVSLANHGLLAGQVYTVYVSTAVGGLTLIGQYIIVSITNANTFVIASPLQATSAATVYENSPILSTTNGSAVVTVNLPNHGFTTGQNFNVQVPTTVGGLTLSGNYIITSVPTTGTLTFNAPSNATSTATTNEAIGAGEVQYLLNSGIASASVAPGFGQGLFGLGPFGVGVLSGSQSPLRQWTMGAWGQDLMACPTNGPIYNWIPTGGVYNNPAAIVSSNAPVANTAIFIAMPQQMIVALGSSTGNVQNPMLIRWCDVADYTDWTATDTNQAGSFRLSRGNRIVGGLQGPSVGFIWTDVGLWTMNYVQPPYVWGFNEIGQGCGLIGARAACIQNGVVYWMSNQKFCMFAGNGVRTIPCAVWDIVFRNMNASQTDKIVCAANSAFDEVTWFYQSATGTEIDSYVKLNTQSEEWDYGSLVRTAWADESVIGLPVGVDGNGLLQQHEIGNDADGAAMDCYAETGWMALSEGQDKIFLERLLPDFIASSSENPASNPALNVTVYVSDYPWATPKVEGPFVVTQQTPYVIVRARGRYVRLKIEGNDLGSFWRLGKFRYIGSPSGRR